MTKIEFKTPNARRQAEDWLFRHFDEEPDSGLLSIAVMNDAAATSLKGVAEDYVLVLPFPINSPSPNSEVIWRAPQAGSYGLYLASMVNLGEAFFHVCSSTEELLNEIVSYLKDGFHLGRTSEELSEKLTFSQSGNFIDVRKKKGVKL